MPQRPPPEKIPPPPWLEFPGESSVWGGWKQGPGYAWMMSFFLPFWEHASTTERDAYLAQHPVPDEDWQAWIDWSRRLE
jgi:hypothetical protein